MGDKSSIIWFITLLCRHHKTFRTPLHSCRRRTRSRRRTRTRRNSPETYGQQRESPPPFCFARVLVGSQPKTYGHRDRDHFISYRIITLVRSLGSPILTRALFQGISNMQPMLIIEVWMIDETSLGWLDTHLNLSIFCCYVIC
ncbi:hypothetical protein HanIR_Chr05g0246771 [Helianthus annuus]|nr:hypothetical protein HanIR_Chr05g0246771 [Helianthus annuus]